MKITPKRSFVGRDGNHIPFGKEINVDDEDGKYYVGQGWATPVKSGEAERAIDPASSGTSGLDVDGRSTAEKDADEKQIPQGVDYVAEADPEKAKKFGTKGQAESGKKTEADNKSGDSNNKNSGKK